LAPSSNRFYNDPAGNHSPQFLQACGPILNVNIHVPSALAQNIAASGGTIPTPEAGLALIDTGASSTCVHEPVLLRLGLNAIGNVMSGTAAGQVQHNRYPARLEFPGEGIDREFASVTGVDLSGQVISLSTGIHPIIALIGRDLMADWILIYNGHVGLVSISF